jgi:anti-anti-sigma regulatory factor
MDVEALESCQKHVLKLAGSWTIERAQELKHLLVTALRDNAFVTMDLQGVTEVDLSFLQLLCSAHRAFLEANKHFVLHDDKSAEFKRLVREAGFVRTLGCHSDPYKSCLWKGGWEQ